MQLVTNRKTATSVFLLLLSISSFGECLGRNNFLGTIESGNDATEDICSYVSSAITGTVTVNGNMTINGNLTIYGNLILNGTLTINGNLIIDSDGTFQVNESAEMIVSGNVSNSGFFSALLGRETEGNVSGTITVGGNFYNNEDGNITVGNGGMINVGGTYTNAEGSSTTVENGGILFAGNIDDEDEEINVEGSTTCGDSCCGAAATCSVLLPVELLSFTSAVNAKGKVTINWQTATEINNKGFYLQRANVTDNVLLWEDRTFVEGAGDSEEIISYSYTDNLFNFDAYYRLKQVDYDGKVTYHHSIYVECPLVQEITIYPNPFSDYLNIQIDPGVYQLKLYNFDGRLLHSLNEESTGLKASLREVTSNLSKGNYLLQVKSGDAIWVKRIVKH